jgi:hypothetical protein
MSINPSWKGGSDDCPSIAKFLVALLACLGGLVACAQLASPPSNDGSRAESIAELVALVRADPTKKPILDRTLMRGTVLMIPDPHSPALAVLPIQQNEREFIPIFSDRKIFDQEAWGTGFAGKAVAIDGRQFAGLLKGNETVILNPGHRPAIEFLASELQASSR